MAVRNCAEIGKNLQKIVLRLLANDELVKYLYYTDKDPLSNEIVPEEVKLKDVYKKLIKIIPRIGPKETAHSMITVRADTSVQSINSEFKDVKIVVEVFVPLEQWVIKDDNLRPYAIMGAIEKSLIGKRVDGLGKISGGDFALNFLTEEMSCFKQVFWITTYD